MCVCLLLVFSRWVTRLIAGFPQIIGAPLGSLSAIAQGTARAVLKSLGNPGSNESSYKFKTPPYAGRAGGASSGTPERTERDCRKLPVGSTYCLRVRSSKIKVMSEVKE